MPRKRTRPRKAAEEDTWLVAKVERHEADVEASVNGHVYAPQYAWNLTKTIRSICSPRDSLSAAF